MNKSLNYFKIIILLNLKSLKEYKTNFWMGTIVNLIFTGTLFILMSGVYIAFNDLLNWRYESYIFYILIMGINATISGIFWFNASLNQAILQGELNSLIVKPINTYLQYISSKIVLFVAVGNILYIPILIYFFIFIYSDYSLIQLTGTLLLSFLSMILFFTIYRFMESFAFFFKNSNLFLTPYNTFSNTFDRYPATVFKNSKIFYLSFFSVNAYSSTFTTEYLFGYLSNETFKIILLNISLAILFSTLGIYILWKIGLKKYEAYN